AEYATEGVGRLAVEAEVDLDQVALLIAVGLVVEAGIALGAALELVEEVDDDLGQGHPVDELQPLGRQVLHLLRLAPPALAQVDDGARVVARQEDRQGEERLLDRLEPGG